MELIEIRQVANGYILYTRDVRMPNIEHSGETFVFQTRKQLSEFIKDAPVLFKPSEKN